MKEYLAETSIQIMYHFLQVSAEQNVSMSVLVIIENPPNEVYLLDISA